MDARLTALFVLVLTLVTAGSPVGVRAETADPGIAIEGWFARNKPRSPQIPTPAGPVSPGPVPTPRAPDTGAFVVAGGVAAGADQGDTGWAAFQWDLLLYLGATVEQFEVTFTQAPDNRGDHGVPVMQGCDILEPWGAAPGSNPWEDRPVVSCSSAVVPTEGTDEDGRATFTFDVTEFAESWVEGESFGLAIVPGTPEQESGFAPFQLTLAGYTTTVDEAAEVRPEVVFEFTAADLGFGDGGFDQGGGGLAPPPLEPRPDLDILPDDMGSAPLPAPEVPIGNGDDTAAPPAQDVPTTPISRSSGFPWYGWLLVPIGLAGYWALGTVLGPAGEPLPVREGGVSRLLARRRATTGTEV